MWSLVSLVSVIVVVALSWLACAHMCVYVQLPATAISPSPHSKLSLSHSYTCTASADGSACIALQIGGDFKLVSARRFGLGLSFGYLIIISIFCCFIFLCTIFT